MCMGLLSARMSVHAQYPREKWLSNPLGPLGLQLQRFLSHHAGAGN